MLAAIRPETLAASESATPALRGFSVFVFVAAVLSGIGPSVDGGQVPEAAGLSLRVAV